MANKLQITATALAKLSQAATSGNLVQISAFAVTDSSVDDSTTYGKELYKGLISSITKDENNANTVIALAIIPATAKKVGFGRKVFIYDKDNDLIAYGLIPQFELTGATAEAELSFYLSFCNVAAIKLEAPAEAFVDVATFKNHNHNGLYYQKREVDSFLNKKSNTGHNHNELYYQKGEVDKLLFTKADVAQYLKDLYASYKYYDITNKINFASNYSNTTDYPIEILINMRKRSGTIDSNVLKIIFTNGSPSIYYGGINNQNIIHIHFTLPPQVSFYIGAASRYSYTTEISQALEYRPPLPK